MLLALTCEAQRSAPTTLTNQQLISAFQQQQDFKQQLQSFNRSPQSFSSQQQPFSSPQSLSPSGTFPLATERPLSLSPERPLVPGITISGEERRALLGHLEGRQEQGLVLSPRQREAAEQENRLRAAGLPAFTEQQQQSPQQFQPQPAPPQQQQFNPLQQSFNSQQQPFQSQQQQPQSIERPPRLQQFVPQQQPAQQARQPPQRFTPQPAVRVGQQAAEAPRQSLAATVEHPERLLNQLSPQQKQLFLRQFSALTQQQQDYAYNKFLSTPPQVQH